MHFLLFIYIYILLFYRQAQAEEEEIIEKTPIEKQILASSELLDKLSVEGDEVVGVKDFLI